MGWTNWPGGVSVTSTGIGSAGASYSVTYNTAEQWSWWVQAWLALRERHAVTGNGCSLLWPPGDKWFPQSQGTVESIVDNHDGTMTVSMTGYFYWTGGSGCSSPRWVGYSCGSCLPNIPADYDLIITTDDTNSDPFQVYRGQITAETYTAGNDYSSSSSADDTPSSGTLTITSQLILDAITANYLASLSTLVGATWYIVKRDSPWTSERLPDKPDPRQLWLGTSSSGGTATISSVLYSTLTDTTASWTNFFSPTAREVLVYGDDGALHRETIVGNTGNMLWFAHRSYTAAGAYKIVVAGTVGKPGRTILPYLQYYTGFSTGYDSHLTDGTNDSIGSWPIAGGQVNIQVGDFCSSTCSTDTYPTLDADLFYPTYDTCDGQNAGKFISNNHWKSLHAIQKDIEGLCTSFLPYMDYTGKTHNEINSWQTATFFNDNSINSWTCSYTYIPSGSDTGDLTVSGAPTGDATPSYPIPCYYAIIYDDGSVSGGRATLASPTLLTGATFPEPTASTTSESSGFPDTPPQPVSLVLSLAWSRRRERQFLYMFNKTGFIPDQNEGAAVDPPTVVIDSSSVTCECGAWQKRPKSTHYKTREDDGMAVDGSIAFIDTEMARYVGDNANGPGISPVTQAGSSNPLVPYYDKFFRGTYGSYIEKQRQAGKTGNITGKLTGSYTSQSITDGTKNWWVDGVNGSFVATASGTLSSIVPPVGMTPGSAATGATAPESATSCSFVVVNGSDVVVLSGNCAVTGGSSITLTGSFSSGMAGYTVTMTFQGYLHTETGVATSGSTTSITDSSHDTTCWFQNSRFEDFSDPSAYTEFIVEINHSGTLYKLPVTSTTNSSGVTIHFSSIGVTFGAGDTWTIYEPAYEINRWQDRPLQIKDGNTGNVYNTTITFNDYNTLYFGQVYNASNSPVTITPATDGTWQYTITDPTYGGVWKWNAATSLWVEVTGGSDTTRLGVTSPQPFKSDSRCNLPTIYKDYGAIQPDDIITTLLFSEVYTTINSMVATIGTVPTWHNYSSDAMTAENNYNGRTTGVNDDQDFTTSAAQWSALAPVAQAYSTCAGSTPPSGPEIHYYFDDGTGLDNTAPYADATTYQGMGGINCATGDCSNPPSSLPDSSTEVDGSWVYAYEVVDGICNLFSCTCDMYAFSPTWPDATGDYFLCGTDHTYSVAGASLWTGASVTPPLQYNLWTKVASVGGSSPNRYSGKIGSEPVPVSWTITSGGSLKGGGTISTGFQITDQLSILKWSFSYV